mmetsp:Transcript_27686/g.40514  ORF Transcript_27686/g.40514 Transcript_27686/m.40514 type:complete len:209 (+) Transcript_27686:76-702(+)
MEEDKIFSAATIQIHSVGYTTAKAMKVAGFSEDECSNFALRKRIQRQIQQILHPPKSPVPKRVVVRVGESVTIIVTENEQTYNQTSSSSSRTEIKNSKEVPKAKKAAVGRPKGRHSSHRVAEDAANKQKIIKRENMAYSVAEEQLRAQLAIEKGTKKLSAEKIVNTVNELYLTSVSAKTLRNRILKGLPGPPSRKGRKSTIPCPVSLR